MILTHGANSLTMDYYVEIGGYKYPVVKIGNRLWMAENFKYHTTATFKYPNNSSDNEERYGLLYNLSGINEIKAMDLNGFRMPVYADGEALYNEFQSNVPAEESVQILADSKQSLQGHIIYQEVSQILE